MKKEEKIALGVVSVGGIAGLIYYLTKVVPAAPEKKPEVVPSITWD